MKIHLFLLYVCECVPVYVRVHCVFLLPWTLEEDVGSGVTDDCERPSQCWELNPGSFARAGSALHGSVTDRVLT